jgi:hypothetical protein
MYVRPQTIPCTVYSINYTRRLPRLPTRPVRPMRWTYSSISPGRSKLMTCLTWGISRPRAATYNIKHTSCACSYPVPRFFLINLFLCCLTAHPHQWLLRPTLGVDAFWRLTTKIRSNYYINNRYSIKEMSFLQISYFNSYARNRIQPTLPSMKLLANKNLVVHTVMIVSI